MLQYVMQKAVEDGSLEVALVDRGSEGMGLEVREPSGRRYLVMTLTPTGQIYRHAMPSDSSMQLDKKNQIVVAN